MASDDSIVVYLQFIRGSLVTHSRYIRPSKILKLNAPASTNCGGICYYYEQKKTDKIRKGDIASAAH